eukprot:12415271-Karenia_brevis.AAC.1
MDTFSFTKRDMKLFLEAALKEKQGEWALDDVSSREWVEVMDKRVRAANHDIAHTMHNQRNSQRIKIEDKLAYKLGLIHLAQPTGEDGDDEPMGAEASDDGEGDKPAVKRRPAAAGIKCAPTDAAAVAALAAPTTTPTTPATPPTNPEGQPTPMESTNGCTAIVEAGAPPGQPSTAPPQFVSATKYHESNESEQWHDWHGAPALPDTDLNDDLAGAFAIHCPGLSVGEPATPPRTVQPEVKLEQDGKKDSKCESLGVPGFKIEVTEGPPKTPATFERADRTIFSLGENKCYGWCVESGKAWRANQTRTNQTVVKIYTSKLEEPASGADDDPMVAIFPDGDEWPVSAVTFADWKAKKEAVNSTKRGRLWSDVHTVTGNDVYVLRRKDGPVNPSLIVMKEKAKDEKDKQVLQVKIKDFENEDAAVNFMIMIAKLYVANDIEKSSLYAERDARLSKCATENSGVDLN